MDLNFDRINIQYETTPLLVVVTPVPTVTSGFHEIWALKQAFQRLYSHVSPGSPCLTQPPLSKSPALDFHPDGGRQVFPPF